MVILRNDHNGHGGYRRTRSPLKVARRAVQSVAELEPRLVRVEVPVQVPCRVKPPAVPAWAAEGLRKEDSLEVKVRALLAERRQRIGYERELVGAIRSCD